MLGSPESSGYQAPKKQSVPRILYVGIVHLDVPEALATITGAITKGDFNILTSLLRKKTAVKSGYEAVLEYVGNGAENGSANQVPSDKDEKLKWFEKQLFDCDDKTVSKLRQFEVQVRPPEYPQPSSGGQDGHDD